MTRHHPTEAVLRIGTLITSVQARDQVASTGALIRVRGIVSRNGYQLRDCDTCNGTVEPAIAKLRNGSYFREWLLERHRHAGQTLVSAVAASHLLGVGTRRVGQAGRTDGHQEHLQEPGRRDAPRAGSSPAA
jgi:hypothetical protein